MSAESAKGIQQVEANVKLCREGRYNVVAPGFAHMLVEKETLRLPEPPEKPDFYDEFYIIEDPEEQPPGYKAQLAAVKEYERKIAFYTDGSDNPLNRFGATVEGVATFVTDNVTAVTSDIRKLQPHQKTPDGFISGMYIADTQTEGTGKKKKKGKQSLSGKIVTEGIVEGYDTDEFIVQPKSSTKGKIEDGDTVVFKPRQLSQTTLENVEIVIQ